MESIGDILKRQREHGLIPDHQPTEIKKLEEEDLCPNCRGGRFVHPRQANGQPDYSRTVPCRVCMTQEAICRSLGISSLSATFDNFEPVKGTEDALRAAKRIASMKTDWKLLLIYGTWGNGKTHLLEAIAIELWNQGYHARVQTFPDFVARLKGTFDNKDDGVSFNTLMNSLCSNEFLLLDDVGTAGSFTPFSLNQLERIMLARYRDNLLTVMTTNLDYASLPEFVTSRFSDAKKARIVLNEAPDYRPRKIRIK